MPWDALDALDDARDATRALLTPVVWRRWLRLAVVTFFVGGIGGGGAVAQAVQGAASAPRSVDVGRGPLPTDALVDSTSVRLLGGVVVAVGAVLTVYALAGAVAEFVLVAGVHARRFELRLQSRQYLLPGVRLFAFRAAVVTALVVAGAVPLLSVFGVVSVPVVRTLARPLLVVAALLWAAGLVCLRLTADLVVPTMLAETRGVLSAWRRVAALVRANWWEVAAFLVVRVVLGVVASFVVGLAVGLAALVVAVPFALAGSVVVFTVGLQGTGLVVATALAVGFVTVVGAVSVVVQVPVVTYFRCYGLAVIGRLDGRLDLLEMNGDRPGRR